MLPFRRVELSDGDVVLGLLELTVGKSRTLEMIVGLLGWNDLRTITLKWHAQWAGTNFGLEVPRPNECDFQAE